MKEHATILVVDGDRQSVQAQARLLEDAGHSVALATTGQEGLHLAQETHPDLILLDVVLPDLNGLEICRRIKADPALKQAFVVLLSGVGTKSHEQAEGLEAGADGVIVRPIAGRELLARVEAFLRIQEAEAQLRASEAHYRDVFENAPIGIYRTTPEGEVLMANPALVRMLGYSSFAELAQRDLESEGYHPEYPRSEFKRRIEEEGQVRGLEAAWRRKDGSTLFVRENARAVTDAHDQLVGYQGTVEDISGRKAAERALRASERRYRALFESTGAATCVFGPDGFIQLCNRKFEALAGLPKERIEGQLKWSDFVAHEDLDRMQAYHAQRTEGTGNPPAEYAFTFVNAQGKRRDIYLQIHLVRETGERVASLADVTPLKQAEKALRASEERYRTLFESSPEAIALLDLQGTVVDCNPATEELAGQPSKEIIGRRFMELGVLDAEDLPGYAALFSRLLRGERVEPLELEMTRDDGETRWLEAFPVPIIKQGETHAIQVIARDITERKRGAASLHRSLEERAHSERLLLALSRAAQAVQRARSTEGVYRAIGEQVAELGFDAAVFTLSEDRAHLGLSHVTFKPNLERVTEEVTGLSAEGYRFPLPRGSFFQRMIAGGETTFHHMDTVPFADALPRPVQLVVRRLARRLGWEQAIYAPLTIGGEAQGLLAIAGTDLTVSDVSAISAFANQAAIAIENARLYWETHQLAAFNESIVQSMAEGIVMEDADGTLTFVNPAAAAMLGYTRDELVGSRWTDIVPPDQRAVVEAANERRRCGEADQYQLELMPKDGQRLPVFTAGSPRLDRQGHFAGTLAVFTDISKLKQVEEALKESEDKFRSVVEQSADGVVLADQRGRIIQWNNALERISGLRAQEVMGRPLRDVLVPATQEREETVARLERFQAVVNRALGKEQVPWSDRVLEQDICRPDGTSRTVDLLFFPIETAKGPIIGGIVRDITERRRAEDALRESQKQLQQQERLAAVGQLAGGIAHDFNNILAAIILYAQMPLRRPDLPSAVRSSLQTILKESRRAADLIQQILDFSRRAMMKTEALSLVAVVTETLMLLRRTIPEHIRLVTEVTSHPCIVQADRTRIQQVLMNLALNAKDAMPKGGDLRIAVTPVNTAPQDEPPLPDMPPGAWVCLSICDTGTGMTKQVQEHLFEPFFTTKEPGKGTGLGLAQVYGIVKQHGGFIGVDTDVGKGTTFTIFLPLVDERDEEQGAGGRTAPLRGRGETILVVEDAGRLRRAIKAGLEQLGYGVITATNGQEALETVSLQDIDLVLTDLVMPEMGGEALLRSLRTQDPHVKVIALTGHVMDRDVTELQAAGFADAVSKPFSIEDLSRVVRDVLDHAG
jgi:PAS domain S-box-containing protein